MPTYTAPTRDMQFVLHDVLNVSASEIPGYDELDRDFTAAILGEAGKIASEVLSPLNPVGDRQGCTLENGVVRTPDGFKEAFGTVRDGGWTALDCDPEYGGQGLPYLISTAVGEMFSAANMAFNMYQGLTHGAYNAIHAHGSEAQKQTYLPKLVSSEWGGTMNLTEPHCGTDLGLIRTKAVPQDDGSYQISGQKIWISAGEHDMVDNIVHLVLAKLPDAPEGVKGISLFIVPKFLVNDDGSLGDRNALQCGGLEEKMGIHGNATCVMNYDGAKGWLVGDENKGLRTMFIMMNEARLGVGLQGLGLAEIAYQYSLAFAKDRIQGRSLTGPKYPEDQADPIIVHPDVRRMLMNQKVFVEGARALALWTALHGDLEHKSEDDATREKSGDYMALLTPVIKGYLTDKGYDCVSEGLQVHGGSGFTAEWGIEQTLRDARITLIYEGTNGIQALDLVGRKLAMAGMRPINTFFGELDEFIAENEGDADLKASIEGLKSVKAKLQKATNWLVEKGLENFDNAGAASTDYMHLFGLTCMAYMWAKMAKTANAKIKEGASDPIYASKQVCAKYFVERWLPLADAHLARVESGADTMMALDADAF